MAYVSSQYNYDLPLKLQCSYNTTHPCLISNGMGTISGTGSLVIGSSGTGLF